MSHYTDPWSLLDPMERSMYAQRLYARASGIGAAVALTALVTFGILAAVTFGATAFGIAYVVARYRIGLLILADRGLICR